MAGRNGMGPVEGGPLTGRGKGFCSGTGESGKGKGLSGVAGLASAVCGAGYGLYRMWRRGGWGCNGFRENGNRGLQAEEALKNEAKMLKERLRFVETKIGESDTK